MCVHAKTEYLQQVPVPEKPKALGFEEMKSEFWPLKEMPSVV